MRMTGMILLMIGLLCGVFAILDPSPLLNSTWLMGIFCVLILVSGMFLSFSSNGAAIPFDEAAARLKHLDQLKGADDDNDPPRWKA